MYYLKQCTLHKEDMRYVAYIPEKYAKVGDVIKIKRNDEWSDGWTVKSVSSEKITSDEVPELQTRHKRHRKQSDI